MLRDFVADLADLSSDVDDAERVDQIRLLEELKSAASAAQARVVAAQVALAKRESPARARRFVGWSTILVTELPRTFAALQSGLISEWRAQIVARETAWLSQEDRARVDAEIAPHLEEWGDRRVTLRPAPDCMSSLTALLPVAQGVSVLAALGHEADSLRSEGDSRARSQIMADTLVQRVTGQGAAAAVPARVELIMTDQTFFNTGAGSDEPAHLIGCGTIPAELARRLVATADDEAEAWVRRLYADPAGRLAAMESTSRRFDGALGDFLVIRDQVCRTPWCDAPVRHGDHVVPVDAGGRTTETNGQGLCEACNQAKEAVGWGAVPRRTAAEDLVEIITPTGHRYRSRPPDPPGTRRPRAMSAGERYVADLVWAA